MVSMIIYKITNKLNGKIYVGLDIRNDSKYLGSGVAITRAVKKYGTLNFEKEILEECKDIHSLRDREFYWIDKLNSTDPDIGYNIYKNRKKIKIKNKDEEITTFKIDAFLHKNLKIKLIALNMTQKELFTYAIHLFVSGSEFKNKIIEYKKYRGKNDN